VLVVPRLDNREVRCQPGDAAVRHARQAIAGRPV
jgi:hypothetical protein